MISKLLWLREAVARRRGLGGIKRSTLLIQSNFSGDAKDSARQAHAPSGFLASCLISKTLQIKHKLSNMIYISLHIFTFWKMFQLE